jgi:hypothetical protein
MSVPTDPGSNDPESEEFFALEVTRLPPPAPSAGQSPAAGSGHRRIPRRGLLLAVGAVLLAMALLLQSVARLPASLTRHSPIQAATAPSIILGAVPSGCPVGNLVYTFSADYAPGAGLAGLDVWLVGFSPSTATLHLGYSPRTKLGWEYPLLLVVNAGLTQPITLQVEPVVGGGGEVWLSRMAVEQASGILTFNPRTDLAHPAGRWKSWLFFVFIASAGCYYLDLHYGASRTPGTFFAAGE